MQDALEKFFGPWLGFAGFAMMFIMIAPKFISRWRGFRLRKRGADNQIADCQLAPRILNYAGNDPVPTCPEHERFGKARAELKARKIYLLLTALAWLVPFFINLFLPASVRDALFLLTIPLFFIGIWKTRHVLDHTLFYDTGFVQQIGFNVREIDYNAVTTFRKRTNSMGLATCYIFVIADESPISFVCHDYFNGSRTVARVIKGLGPRSIKSAANEAFLNREA